MLLARQPLEPIWLEHIFVPARARQSSNMVSLIASLNVFPHRIFLLDGLGAVLSAACLGLVLAHFPDTFGASPDMLYLLAGMAGVFAVYSLACYFLAPIRWRPYLVGIAIANTLYGFFTIWLVFGGDANLTLWGRTYFVLELIVLAGLIFLELSRATQFPPDASSP